MTSTDWGIDGLPNKALWAWECTFGKDADYRWLERPLDRRVNRDAHFIGRTACIAAYCFSIPTDEALALIAKYGPIVEIGAGTGYWAALLQDRGVDVLAFDHRPPALGHTANRWFKNTESFTHVETADEAIVSAHVERTLMLAWPPYGDPMATHALDLYRGQHVIYIGEGAGGCCADDKFFDALNTHWIEETDLLLPQWDGINDWLTVYGRT